MKRFIAILLTLVIAFSLISCGNSGRWYELPKSKPYGYTYYVNIDFEDLDIGTYNVIYMYSSTVSEERPGILFVYEDRYDLVTTHTNSYGEGGTGVTSFPK